MQPSWEAAYRYRSLAYLCAQDFERAAADGTQVLTCDDYKHERWDRYVRATSLWILGRHAAAAEDYRTVCRLSEHVTFSDARLFLVLRDHAKQAATAGNSEAAAALESEARQVLRKARKGTAPADWLGKILACLDAEQTPESVATYAEEAGNPEMICEAGYYAGEACLLRNRLEATRAWFSRCVATDLMIDPDVYPP